jgi:UbiD family decarboxylase
VTAIARNDPILRHRRRGVAAELFGNAVQLDHALGHCLNVLDRAGIPGVTDVWGPRHGTMDLNVQIKQTYRNQAKQVANAIWGSSASHVRYKHVTVVDDDIDIHDYARWIGRLPIG